jgi:flagellar P-ring protein precursor FlgI
MTKDLNAHLIAYWHRCGCCAVLIGMLLLAVSAQGQTLRIKDIGKMSGWRENALIGYGLVTGLAGTGDSGRNKATRQSLANLLSRFDLTISADDVQSRNVAAVMVTSSLSPFARPGDALDVTVTSVGDARSLVGGTLILAPLKGPDGQVYALAQGAVAVGGYKYDLNGNVIQKNHPTVGSIPNGATIEVGLASEILSANNTVTFVLSQPDYTTATRVATAINGALGGKLAQAQDASGIEIRVPEQRREDLSEFLAALENVQVEPDRRAKVVINERTGTVVTGGDVRIAKVAISQGDLKVSIVTENSASQTLLVRQPGAILNSAGASNTRVNVEEKAETGFIAANSNTVADLVQALTRVKTNTRDIISILRAVKAAGALHAELIVQ